MTKIPRIGEGTPALPSPPADPWGPEEMMVPAPVAAALSAGTFAVLAVIAVLVA